MIKKAYVYKDDFKTMWLKVEYDGGGSKAFKLDNPHEDLKTIERAILQYRMENDI
jgi:hypothetical protein